MAKLGVLLLAAVAVQAVLAGQSHNEQQQNRQLQHLAEQVQQVSRDVVRAIQNFDAQTSQGRRYLAHQANDYSYNMQKVVYYMQQAYNQHHQSFQGETQKNMKEIAQKLAEISYNVQQAMNTDAEQLKTQFGTQVQIAAQQAEKMAEVAQQMQQQGDFKQQMKEVLYYFLSATQQLRTQIHHQQQNHQVIYGEIQQAANQAISAVQNVNMADEQTAEDMSAQTQQFAQKMNHMIHKIQQWVNNHHHHHHHDQQQQQEQIQAQQQSKMYMQQVANQMSEMHAELQQAANSQGYAEQKINKMKAQMSETIRGITTHMQKMVQVAQSANQSQQQQDGHSASHVAKSVLIDFLAACRNMKTEMEIIAQSHQ